MNPPSSFVHHHLPHLLPPSRCHLPRSLQLALVQVGASGEQIATTHQLPAMSEWRGVVFRGRVAH